MSRDIETMQDYKEYCQSVDEFFKSEGIDCLSFDTEEYGEDGDIEPHFSWSPCDCCGGTLGGNREIMAGYNPTTKEIQRGYSVCEDCVYFVEYGTLDDMTMMRISEE